MKIDKSIIELFFPKGILEWFDIIQGYQNEEAIHFTLQEKNIPPLSEKDRDKKVIPKGFKEITITDFPLRGKKTLIKFKRRYWQVEGQKEYLKRDIKLCFPGTQLAKEFADFLKEKDRTEPHVAEEYRLYV